MTAQELGRKEKMTTFFHMMMMNWGYGGRSDCHPPNKEAERSTGIIRTRPIGVWYVSHQSHCSLIPTYHGHP